jgi:hypothetical protein
MSRIGRGRQRSASPQIPLDALLRKLSQRTSLILPAPGTPSNRGPGTLRLVRQGHADEAVPMAMHDHARRAGLIEKLPDGSGWRLSQKGRELVRRLVSGGLARDVIAPDGLRPGHDLDESPLAWLRRRRRKDGLALISDEQFLAGERLRADFTFAQLGPRVTANWDFANGATNGSRRGAAGEGVDMADNVIAAGERVRSALRAVGPELAGTLIDVCCFLKGLEELERDTGWPQRSAKVVLELALTSLARHYGLLPETEAAEFRRPSRHWGTPDYRPLADGGPERDQPTAD